MNSNTLATLTAILSISWAANASADPLYPNSVVSNNIDFITADDPSAFESLRFHMRDRREMPDKRKDQLFDEGTFVFEAIFSDGTALEIWAHSEFGTTEDAAHYAQMVTDPLGKLPSAMRRGLSHVVINKGDETAFGEDKGHFFVLYSENMDTRVSNHDLEETVFHESVHATLDLHHADGADWLAAQRADNEFITEYAANNPDGEDLAETALFAVTLLKHPGRLPSDVESWMASNIPNRLNYFRTPLNDLLD